MMRPCTRSLAAWVLALVATLVPSSSRAQTLVNQADGSASGTVLDVSLARVNLLRVGAPAASAVAEIDPNSIRAGTLANAFAYDILPTIVPGNAGVNRVEIAVPPGYGNLAVTGVDVFGANLAAACPTPGSGQYCASLSGATLTVTLGDTVTQTLHRIRVLFSADSPAAPGSGDFTSVVANGTAIQPALAGNADGDASDANSLGVVVTLSQGLVLDLRKAAGKSQVLIGEPVTYAIAIRNTASSGIVNVSVYDTTPPNFKFVTGSARLDGAPLADPPLGRPLAFVVGTVPALVDGNGNGRADPGEAGYRVLSYQLIAGSGATPGRYENTAVARDFCDTCDISNVTKADVEVRVDPLFDLGTIIGKVFFDRNGDGLQDPDEPGVGGAFVALDDGTYALTDEFGRYHFPAVRPGYRMLKIDLHRLPPGATATDEVSRIVWLTPGLMVTADFGVRFEGELQTIGEPATHALALQRASATQPVAVQGNADAFTVLVNGGPVALPAGEVRLTQSKIGQDVRVRGAQLESPVRFELESPAGPGPSVDRFTLTVSDSHGQAVKVFEGQGTPPPHLSWDGICDDGKIVPSGGLYAYQLELRYGDGSVAKSTKRLFGVNRTTITSLELSGDAFETGKATLSPQAKRALDAAAAAIRNHPGEKILIEGHTDSDGSSEANLELSRNRAQAALDYLVRERRLPADRFALAGYGEERPVASNDTPEGRTLNRRVVIQAELADAQDVAVRDQYRDRPKVSIDGREIAVGEEGRFASSQEVAGTNRIDVAMTGPNGRSVSTSVTIPGLSIDSPKGDKLLEYGGSDAECSARAPNADGVWASGQPKVICTLAGKTEAGNHVEVAGLEAPVDASGRFTAPLPLDFGNSEVGVLVRNAAGVTRLSTVSTSVTDRDADGALLVSRAGVPNLSVNLPPPGIKLSAPGLMLAGATDPGNRVTVNGTPMTVGADGSFQGSVDLPFGPSRVFVEVTDPAGRTGRIEQDVDVAKNSLFLLAFADGAIGKLSGSGNLEGAGLDESSQLYTNGRLAYYLKGTIAGKYLITSAYDNMLSSDDPLLGDLGLDAGRKLLTNLDPDRYYPIYGDASTVVNDAESRGKFYLAVDSDTIHAVFGDYPLSMNDTELAAYRRTLYGGRFNYVSAAKTRYGDPKTEVVAFAAQARHAHVQDEVRGTGGSLYYLSRQNVVEGSEQVTLVVRDKLTLLQLSTERLVQNVDYEIKYDEGRILFRRPIQSVQPGGGLIQPEILSGNPVSILIDYETVVSGIDKTGYGGRVRQQIGDHVAVGGTYVNDQLEAGSYELQGVDAEVRFGANSRVVAEAARTSGSGSVVNVSNDGGLSYSANPASPQEQGNAYKVAGEFDVGEWFGRPSRYTLSAYAKRLEDGFFSSGNLLEQGTTKIGATGLMKLTDQDTLTVHYDQETRNVGSVDREGVQYAHTEERWGVQAEVLNTNASVTGTPVPDRGVAAAQFWFKPIPKLTLRAGHQQTFSGVDDTRTSLDVAYQVLPHLALEVEGVNGTQGHSAQAGVAWTRGDSNVYVTRRMTGDVAGDRTATVIGARSPLGKASKVYTEYQWEDADSGGRVLRLLGLQRQWDVFTGLQLQVSAELADVNAATGDASRKALSAGLAYSNGKGLSLATREEYRLQDGTSNLQQILSVTQLDYQATEDLAMLARWRYSQTTNRNLDTIDARFDERVLGLAYRPVRNQRFNALFKYTYLDELRPQANGVLTREERSMDVLSLDTSYRFVPRAEWLSKVAGRRMNEAADGGDAVTTNTFLLVQRMNLTVWKPLSLGLEYRIFLQKEAQDRRQGFLSEAMWNFTKYFRAGLGYNFTDFSDDMTSSNDYRMQGWFLRVQGRY